MLINEFLVELVNITETNRQWKLLPCPGILLGLLIDRTSHSAILH